MIKIDETLPELTRELLLSMLAFLHASGVNLDDVDVFSGSLSGGSRYRFDYSDHAQMKTGPCYICFPARDGEHVLETDLSSGRVLFSALLRLKGIPCPSEFPMDETPAVVLERFGLEADEHVWVEFPEEPDTSFVSSSDQWYVFGYRDIYPPARIISRSRHTAAPAIHLAMDVLARETDLHAELGSFMAAL